MLCSVLLKARNAAPEDKQINKHILMPRRVTSQCALLQCGPIKTGHLLSAISCDRQDQIELARAYFEAENPLFLGVWAQFPGNNLDTL